MEEGKREPLIIRVHFSGGAGSLRATPEHPLLAPLRVALTQGKPPGRWTWVAVHDPLQGIFKLLGSFVHSVGDRLLFFPGVEATATLEPGSQEERFDSQRIDHLALDPPDPRGRHRSHFAFFGTAGKDSRGIKYSTKPPPGLLAPWFTLIAPSLENFEILPAEFEVTFPPPRPDTKQFGNDIFQGPKLVTAPLPPGEADSFFQLDVWAGRTENWKALGSRPLAWAYKSELVREAPAERQGIRAVQGDIDFTSYTGLRLICSRPRGKVDGPHILRPTLRE